MRRRSLHVELAWLRFEVARLRRQNALLALALQQARRDRDLMAAGWRDRTAAAGFLRDLGRIDELGEAG